MTAIKFVNLGADPEFFVHSGKEYFPSIPFTKGTKQRPEKIGNNFYMQKDNILLEGNIPPADTREKFIEYIEFLKTHFNKVVLAKGSFHIRCEDSARFKPRFLRLPEALDFGCEPFFNAWTGGIQKAPELNLVNRRPAGFHIHIGYLRGSSVLSKWLICRCVVKAFDIFVVNPARHHYFDEFRSLNYGMFGSYRHVPYGVECRALGGHFLKKEYLGWIWDQTLKVIDFLSTDSNLLKVSRWEGRHDIHKFLPKKLYQHLDIKLSDQFIKIKEVEHA